MSKVEEHDIQELEISLKNFELENSVQISEDYYLYNNKEQQDLLSKRPWTQDVKHFKKVKVSVKALIKMFSHTKLGGNIEVMGIMLGKIHNDTMVVVDSFALPVEGTETRVNAQNQGNEYMIDYIEKSRQVGRLENVIGWYHSHPGYGPWLSGIDVATQDLNQTYQDPFLAIVIDPLRSVSAGKVDIGAFRTYPKSYVNENAKSNDGFQPIPLDKMEDFGAHANSYYPLDISYFKSEADQEMVQMLWNQYWIDNLAQSTLFSNLEHFGNQVDDLHHKLERALTTANAHHGSGRARNLFHQESIVVSRTKKRQSSQSDHQRLPKEMLLNDNEFDFDNFQDLAHQYPESDEELPYSSHHHSLSSSTKGKKDDIDSIRQKTSKQYLPVLEECATVCNSHSHALISEMIKALIFGEPKNFS